MCKFMTSPTRLIVGALLLIGLLPVSAFAFDSANPTFVHAMIGSAQFSEDDLTFAGTSSEDDSATGYNDLSEMPYFGLAFQHYFHGTDSAFGLDGGVLLGLKARDTRAVGGSGQIAIAVDSELWLVDLSIGVFAEHTLAERWRFYIAAGPTIILGDYSEDIEEEHFATHEITTSKDSDSQFSMGGYARAGVDYNFGYDSWIGLCVRGVKTNLEFDDAPNASSGLSGGQAFITFSRHF